MEKMKALVIRSYGGTDVLAMEMVPVPSISDNEVLVKVHAAGVNPLDWKVRAGYLKEMLPYEFPLILGWDLSGTVEKAGSGVSGLKIGDEVFGLADITRNGACAQFIAVRADTVAIKPSSLDHIQAASIPMGALTAWQALFDVAGLVGGQRVLVHAAAGGVGSMAVQLAKDRGAHVIGTASGPNREFVLGLGAEDVVDYTAGPFENSVFDVDVVLDAMGGSVQDRSWQTLRRGGILVSLLGPPDESKAAGLGVRGAGAFVQPNAEQLTAIAKLLDEGRIKPVVSQVLPLTEVARAHDMSATHHVRGKIVLKVSDS